MISLFRKPFGKSVQASTRSIGSDPNASASSNIECLESRHMLTAGAFLQGIAYVDNNSNNMLDAADTRLPGATGETAHGHYFGRAGDY